VSESIPFSRSGYEIDIVLQSHLFPAADANIKEGPYKYVMLPVCPHDLCFAAARGLRNARELMIEVEHYVEQRYVPLTHEHGGLWPLVWRDDNKTSFFIPNSNGAPFYEQRASNDHSNWSQQDAISTVSKSPGGYSHLEYHRGDCTLEGALIIFRGDSAIAKTNFGYLCPETDEPWWKVGKQAKPCLRVNEPEFDRVTGDTTGLGAKLKIIEKDAIVTRVSRKSTLLLTCVKRFCTYMPY
uniref:hypothetical protein n=1 Tax=uncultured Marinobacter sp. TaxID=187379 RepID=UPI0025965BAE